MEGDGLPYVQQRITIMLKIVRKMKQELKTQERRRWLPVARAAAGFRQRDSECLSEDLILDDKMTQVGAGLPTEWWTWLSRARSLWLHLPLQSQDTKENRRRKQQTDAEGNLQCEYCDYKCKNHSRLKFHIDAVHLCVHPHLCDFCPTSFSTMGALNTHNKSYINERNFHCMFCEKKFHSKGNMLTHTRTQHTLKRSHSRATNVGRVSVTRLTLRVTNEPSYLAPMVRGRRSLVAMSVARILPAGHTSHDHMTAHDDSSEQMERGGAWCGGGKQKKYSNGFKLVLLRKWNVMWALWKTGFSSHLSHLW